MTGVGEVSSPQLIFMSKPFEKQKAIELRRAGLSYREIRRQVPVAKATLSSWLRSVGHSKSQKQRLTVKRLLAARRGWEKLRRQRVERIDRAMTEAAVEVEGRLCAADWLWLTGTLLYWAEGSKPKEWRCALVEFSNTDLRMLRIVRAWFQQSCRIQESDIIYTLQIHRSADLGAARDYWERELRLTPESLRIYLKTHNPVPRRRNTGKGYYGTIKMIVRRSTRLNYQITGWIHGLTKYWGVG